MRLPAAEGSIAIPYSSHQDGKKITSGNSSIILQLDWNQISGSNM